MRIPFPRILLAAVAAGTLALAGCAAGGTDGGSGQSLPEIGGEFGENPEFSWPGETPPAELEVEVLSEGDGAAVDAGNFVVADYAGYVWGTDEPFDSSFDRGQPAKFPLDGVVAGWRDGIPGHALGSRLLISIPPELGYGPDGQPSAGIGGEDTIVFVVDLISTFSIDALGDADAEPVELPSDVPVTVDGALGEKSSVTIDDGAPAPEEEEIFALSRGSGEEVEDGDTIVVSYTLTTWDNELTESSWMAELGPNAGPQLLPIGAGTPFDPLVGYEVGSRVLLIQLGIQDAPAMAIVADIIDVF